MTKKNTKIEHVWSIVCASSSVDTKTNSLSLFNVIEEITITLSPDQVVSFEEDKNGKLLPFSHELVSIWKKTAGFIGEVSGEIKIKLINPENKILGEFSPPSSVVIPKDKERVRTMINFSNLKIDSAGEYRLAIELAETGNKFKEVFSLPIGVKILKEAKP